MYHAYVHLQVLLLVPLLTASSDLVYTIVRGRSETVAQFQYITPIVIILSMVSSSGRVCVTTNKAFLTLYKLNCDRLQKVNHLIVGVDTFAACVFPSGPP